MVSKKLIMSSNIIFTLYLLFKKLKISFEMSYLIKDSLITSRKKKESNYAHEKEC